MGTLSFCVFKFVKLKTSKTLKEKPVILNKENIVLKE